MKIFLIPFVFQSQQFLTCFLIFILRHIDLNAWMSISATEGRMFRAPTGIAAAQQSTLLATLTPGAVGQGKIIIFRVSLPVRSLGLTSLHVQMEIQEFLGKIRPGKGFLLGVN